MTRDRGMRAALIVVAVLLLVLAAIAVGMLGSVGMLPWQPEPTRIPVAPFEGLGGGGPAATPAP